MEPLIETIQAAVASDATSEARQAGASACRALLARLEPEQSLAPQPMQAAVSLEPIVALAASLRGVPIDQLLDLAIAKLRTALPPGADVPAVAPLKFSLVPVAKR